jgi:hypothetical protein
LASSKLLFFPRNGDGPGSVFTVFADEAAAFSARMVFITP